MEIRSALKRNYHAGLAMLAECVERCPEDLWSAANPPIPAERDPKNPGWTGVERQFWRIAFHNAYFTHLYLGQNEAAFQAPPDRMAVRRRADLEAMWHAPWAVEPYELPTGAEPATKAHILEYIRFVDALVGSTIDALDLESENSGFPWYPGLSKFSHQLMNLRHLQGHIGQLSELLMFRGIDVGWVSESAPIADS